MSQLLRIALALALMQIAAPRASFAADAPPTGDAERGKEIYAQCMYCHAIDQNRVGPMHKGLFGRKAGSVPGFNYSTAMKKAGEKGLVWSPQTLDAYITNPQKVVPGNRMPFGGLSDAQQRADLIAYLKEATAPDQKTGEAPAK
ncbi:MAG TPA: cytochrome c family protein [Candidatus Cybelea sp.]|nr:cytochrome c family protein [Candidatus Cybelea sp.]